MGRSRRQQSSRRPAPEAEVVQVLPGLPGGPPYLSLAEVKAYRRRAVRELVAAHTLPNMALAIARQTWDVAPPAEDGPSAPSGIVLP